MNEGLRGDAILWEVEPEGAGPYGGGSISVSSYQIGVVVKDGEVVEVVLPRRRRARVPRGGEVRTYMASALQFSVAFLLRDSRSATQQGEGVALDGVVLTGAGKLVRGRIDLALRVGQDKDSIKRLLHLLPRDGGAVTKWDVAEAIKEELHRKASLTTLRSTEELLGINESLKAALAPNVWPHGLSLDVVRAELDANASQPPANLVTGSGTDGEDASVSSLHEAAWRGHTDDVLRLVSAGADVNAMSGDISLGDMILSTPLHKAAEKGHTETALALVSFGADINAVNDGSGTPLHDAVHGGHPETALALVKAGADVNVSASGDFAPLHRAAQRDDPEMVSVLVNAGADVNARSEGGTTSLHLAVCWSHLEMVSVLVNAGADINAREESGWTPLHLAALIARAEVARELVTAGADVNARSDGGNTPLHLAALECRAEVALELIHAGADVDARDEHDKTPLHKAVGQGDIEAVRVLVAAGSDVNARSDGGETEDEYWSRRDVTARSEGGVTALHWAALMGHTETAEALISKGADVDARNEEEQTPLHWAAMRGHRETVRVLVNAGADVSAMDEKGFTPPFLAAVEEDQETARELDELAKSERDEPPSEAGPPARRPQSPVAPATPSYWVYDDKVTGSACIHEGACSFCNHGEGMGKGRNEKENEWYGPYGSREEAYRGARRTGRREVRGCGICRP